MTQPTSVIRYIWFNQISHARPVTVVEDRDDLIALHLAPGTKVKGCNPPGDLSDYNQMLLAREWPLLDVEWKWTDVLMLARPGEWFSIWGLWPAGGGDLLSWYVNLEFPITRSAAGYDTRDLQLDIVITPDLQWRWKDEEEFAEMCSLGLVTPDEERIVRAEGERAIEMIEHGDTWWLEWKDWSPDPSWTIPTLTAGWDRLDDGQR